MADNGKDAKTETKPDHSGRNRLLWAGAVGLVAYLVALPRPSLPYPAGGAGGGGGAWTLAWRCGANRFRSARRCPG